MLVLLDSSAAKLMIAHVLQIEVCLSRGRHAPVDLDTLILSETMHHRPPESTGVQYGTIISDGFMRH
jgi:hypothetical protein